jgi:gamma-glutamyl phosphate reductase
VKGINPFSKYLTAEDRQFLLDVKQQLEATFERVASAHAKSETVALNNSIEEIIVETLDLEKDVLGVSLAQLSHKLLVGNSNYVGNTRVAKIQ